MLLLTANDISHDCHMRNISKRSQQTHGVCARQDAPPYQCPLICTSYLVVIILNLKLHLEAGTECNIGVESNIAYYLGDPLRMQHECLYNGV